MIIVTGGAGFIGSNLVNVLNQKGEKEIIVVDELDRTKDSDNLAGCSITDFIDKKEYLKRVESKNGIKGTRYVFHQGACSDTTEQDGKYMMENNYNFSKSLFHYSANHQIPFIYASSAAIYGGAQQFEETPACEKPVNVYAHSKFLFDNYVRYFLNKIGSQVVGLRYFNVYGPRESHKGHMASVAYHVYQQIKSGEMAQLFEGTDGYGNGEQLRDFVYVEDAIALNLWFMDHKDVSGIYNAGTGNPRSFNDVARILIGLLSRGEIRYVEFPKKLMGKYQSYTCADLTRLRSTGCSHHFLSLEEGIEKYLGWLQENQGTS